MTHLEYAQFIRETAFILRTKICKNDYQIVIINDNASIHKADNVYKVVEDNKINFFFTVPYSTQTNLPAENYFSRMKSAMIFEKFIVDDEISPSKADGFDINDDDQLVEDEEGKSNKNILNNTSQHYITIKDIVQRWDHFNREKYDSNSSMNIFYAWETVVNDCKNGLELTGQHYKIEKQGLSKISCYCYRLD